MYTCISHTEKDGILGYEMRLLPVYMVSPIAKCPGLWMPVVHARIQPLLLDISYDIRDTMLYTPEYRYAKYYAYVNESSSK